MHVFCLYEGADIPENMWKRFDSYRHVISEMQSDCYRISGKKVKLFLGGDLSFYITAWVIRFPHHRIPATKTWSASIIYKIMGTVLTHLIIVIFELRDAITMPNVTMRICMKTVISRMMLPITSLDNVVPPILHINLGIVLKLYEMLLHFIQNLDAVESGLPQTWQSAGHAIVNGHS